MRELFLQRHQTENENSIVEHRESTILCFGYFRYIDSASNNPEIRRVSYFFQKLYTLFIWSFSDTFQYFFQFGFLLLVVGYLFVGVAIG